MFELNDLIELTAGIVLASAFSIHGEDCCRNIETDTQRKLLKAERAAAIFPTGSEIAANSVVLWLIKQRALSFWLPVRAADL